MISCFSLEELASLQAPSSQGQSSIILDETDVDDSGWVNEFHSFDLSKGECFFLARAIQSQQQLIVLNLALVNV